MHVAGLSAPSTPRFSRGVRRSGRRCWMTKRSRPPTLGHPGASFHRLLVLPLREPPSQGQRDRLRRSGSSIFKTAGAGLFFFQNARALTTDRQHVLRPTAVAAVPALGPAEETSRRQSAIPGMVRFLASCLFRVFCHRCARPVGWRTGRWKVGDGPSLESIRPGIAHLNKDSQS